MQRADVISVCNNGINMNSGKAGNTKKVLIISMCKKV